MKNMSTVGTSLTVLDRETLPHNGIAFDFEGFHYQDTEVSFIWVDMPAGGRVRLHQHPYKEIFIIQEGTATFTIGSTTLEAHAGQIIIVPANTPHNFLNTGEGRLKQVDIHSSPKFITTWLEE